MRTRAVRIHRHGGPEVLVYEPVDLPGPGPGEVRLRHTASGLNYAEIYQREGEAGPHDAGTMPIILGSQGAGVVDAVGCGLALGGLLLWGIALADDRRVANGRSREGLASSHAPRLPGT